MHGLDQDTLYECMKFSIKDTKGEERQSSNSINSPSIMEISWAILQKTKTRPTIKYIYFSPGYLPKNSKSTILEILVYPCLLEPFLQQLRYRQTRQPPKEQWINRMWYTHTGILSSKERCYDVYTEMGATEENHMK